MSDHTWKILAANGMLRVCACPPAFAFQYSVPRARVLTRRHLTWRSTLIAVFCTVYLLCVRGVLLGMAHGVPIYLLLATYFQGVGWTQVKQTRTIDILYHATLHRLR